MRAAAGLPTERRRKGKRATFPPGGFIPRVQVEDPGEKERERGKRHSKPWLIGFGEGVPPFWRGRVGSQLPFTRLFSSPFRSFTSDYVLNVFLRPRLLLLLFPPERRFELRSRRRKFPSNPSSRRLFGNLEFDCTFARRDQRYEKIVAFRRNFIYPPFSFSLWFFLEIKFERRFEEGEFHCGFVRGFGRDFFRNFIDLLF